MRPTSRGARRLALGAALLLPVTALGAAGQEVAWRTAVPVTGVVQALTRDLVGSEPAQAVMGGPVLVARTAARLQDDVRVADRQVFAVSATGSNDIPSAALRAYRNAEDDLARTRPT